MRAAGAFVEAFGAPPDGVARAPGRINLIGEHIDYNGGLVLPMAIDRDCAVAFGRSGDFQWKILAPEAGAGTVAAWGFDGSEATGWVRGVRPSFASGDWRSYAAGVIACILREFQQPDGHPGGAPLVPAMRLVVASDVPLGAGLSSSASLEVSMARALVHAGGGVWDAGRAARACRRAEHEFAGVPCGIMDQLVSAGARVGHAMLIDCQDPSRVRHIPLPTGAPVAVINTGVRHTLAGGEYAKRAASTAAAAAKLGTPWLCDAHEQDLVAAAEKLTDEERRYARHVVTEQARVRVAVAAMERDDLTSLGRAMNESHDSLRDDYRVSCPELDLVVKVARGVPGVLGARMTGGGFGGCAIVLVEHGAEARLASAVQEAFRGRFGRVPDVFGVLASGGAGLV